MSCFQCGSTLGAASRLCPDCIQRNKAAHQAKLEQIRNPSVTEVGDDLGYKLFTMPIFRIIGVGLILVAFFLFFLFFGPIKDKGPLASFLWSAMLTCSAVSFLTWGLFWFRTLILEPIWAIMSIFMPLLIWRYIFINWEDTKAIFFIHIACLVLSVCFAVLLAKQLHLPIGQVLFISSAYQHGQEVQQIINYRTP